MAKRRRLTPSVPDHHRATAPGRAPEAKPLFPAGPAPIAQIAGDASASAALEQLAGEMRMARESGRLVVALPLDTVAEDWLVRDRLHLGAEEMEDLVGSIAERGQQTPIEVVPLEEGGRYGLISGWRRLHALRRLHAERGEARFATVLAVLRQPSSAAEAYRAMVEENEIRVGLSYYERARIVAKAVEAGVHRRHADALREIFATASRARRSKIASFLTIHEALGDRLKFPTAIPERLGLGLARALEARPELRDTLRERLRKTAPETSEAETALLSRAIRPGAGGTDEKSRRGDVKGRSKREATACETGIETPVPGVRLQTVADGRRFELTLSGPEVNAGFRDRLLSWLRSSEQ